MTSVRMVVLSACETAAGLEHPGDSPLSLQRSFHAAGVPNVLSAKWTISDAETVRLMEHFYERWLGSGDDVGEALRAAKQQLRKRGTHVGWWAAWTMSTTKL